MTPRCRARGPRAARATTAGVRSCAVKWRGATNALCLKFKDKAGGIFLTGERDRCRAGEHLAYQSGLAGCGRVKSGSWLTACLLNGLRKLNIWQLVVQEEYLEHDRQYIVELNFSASRSMMTSFLICGCLSLRN